MIPFFIILRHQSCKDAADPLAVSHSKMHTMRDEHRPQTKQSAFSSQALLQEFAWGGCSCKGVIHRDIVRIHHNTPKMSHQNRLLATNDPLPAPPPTLINTVEHKSASSCLQLLCCRRRRCRRYLPPAAACLLAAAAAAPPPAAAAARACRGQLASIGTLSSHSASAPEYRDYALAFSSSCRSFVRRP